MSLDTMRDTLNHLRAIGHVTTTYCDLTLCSLSPANRERCGYWYTVTHNTLAHTAFRTRPALISWLERYKLTANTQIPDPGEFAVIRLVGAYRHRMHFRTEALDDLDGERVRVLFNGDYTAGVISTDPDGVRVKNWIHHPDRVIFDYSESRRLEDAGN